MRKKKKKKIKNEFLLLSPNVIVFEILTYWEFIANPSFLETVHYGTVRYKSYDLNLFGTFKLDRLRNIWVIFRSIKINDDCSSSLIVDSRKIECLELYFSKEFIYRSLKKIKIFPNLIKLEIIGQTIVYCFFKDFKFPQLKYLSIYGGCLNHYRLKGMNWNSKNFSKLIRLDLIRLQKIQIPPFYFPSLEELCITGCNYKRIQWKFFPKINNITCDHEIHFSNCPITNLNKLFVLNILNCGKTLPKETYNLKEFSIMSSTITDKFFECRFFKKLKRLCIYNCQHIKGDNWNSTINNIKYLRIWTCKKITDKLFEQFDFPKLKYLHIKVCPKIKFKNWKLDISKLSNHEFE